MPGAGGGGVGWGMFVREPVMTFISQALLLALSIC